MSEADYSIRFFRESDKDQIVDLLSTVFDGWPHFDLNCPIIDHFDWKFIDTAQQPVLMALAETEGKIVGLSSNVFQNIKMGDKMFLAVKGTDMAVHPNHRRKGLAMKTRELRRTVMDEKASFTWSFTSNPILKKSWLSRGHIQFPVPIQDLYYIRDISKHLTQSQRSFGSKIVIKVGHIVYNLLFKAWSLIYQSQTQTEKLTTSQVSRFDDSIDNFWETVKNEYNFIAERKKEYLNWRYCDPRGGKYTIKTVQDGSLVTGFYVLRINRWKPDYPEAIVMEFIAAPGRNDVAEAMLKDLIAVCNDENINYILYRIPKEHPYEKLFKRNGFFSIKSNIFIDVRNLNVGDEWETLLNSKGDKLFFQIGDTDSI